MNSKIAVFGDTNYLDNEIYLGNVPTNPQGAIDIVPSTIYLLTVENGSGGSNYAKDALILIASNAAPSGKVFDHWITDNGGSFANATNPSTTFTMPGNAVTVTAIYLDQTIPPASTYSLTLQADTGGRITTGTSGQYAQDEIVHIAAAASSDYCFSGWSSSGGGSFANASDTSTTFEMPAGTTTVTANFRYTGGSSGGSSAGENSSFGNSNSNDSMPLTPKELYTMAGDVLTFPVLMCRPL